MLRSNLFFYSFHHLSLFVSLSVDSSCEFFFWRARRETRVLLLEKNLQPEQLRISLQCSNRPNCRNSKRFVNSEDTRFASRAENNSNFLYCLTYSDTWLCILQLYTQWTSLTFIRHSISSTPIKTASLTRMISLRHGMHSVRLKNVYLIDQY